MAMEERHIVAIDLGTYKTSLTVAGINGDNIQILFYRKIPSDGIRYSYVFNSGKAAKVVRKLVEEAESELKIKIRRAIVGMPKYNVRQESNSGKLDRSIEECISAEEIENLKNMAQETYPLQHPDVEEVFGTVAQSFSNGDEIGLTENDMIGVSSSIIQGNFKIFIGKKQHLHNIDMIFKDLGIDIIRKYFTPDSIAKAVLTPGEMENGVALIDLGAGVTSVSIYYRNIMRHYAAIPFGGNSITSDIKTECQIPGELAENIKKAFGGCMPDKLQNLSEKTLHIRSGSMAPNTQIQVKFLSEIITARMKEIIDAVLYEIQMSGFADNLRSGVVITGGGAGLMNCGNYIKEMSGYDVRSGAPIRNLFSAPGYDSIYNADAEVSAGLVITAKNDRIPECTAEADAPDTCPEIEIERSAGETAVPQENTPEEDNYSGTVFGAPEEDGTAVKDDRKPGKSGKGSGSGKGNRPGKEDKEKNSGIIWEIGNLFKGFYDSLDKEKA